MQYLKITLIFIFTLVTFSACTHKAPFTQRNQMIFMSHEQELALGEESYKQTLAQSKVIKDTKDAKRVKNIGEKIAKITNINDYKWEFNLVENEQMNAFCLPGGKVVVYTGILKVATNDDQLATVISHEIAHALARHGAERVSASMVQQGVQILGNVLLASKAPQYTDVFNQTYGIGTQLGVMLPYGRLQESEADEIGIYLMIKAGYNPNEAIKFWENMSKNKEKTNEFFSTHPSSENRIENIKKIINKINSK